jgi:hypothetical protein
VHALAVELDFNLVDVRRFERTEITTSQTMAGDTEAARKAFITPVFRLEVARLQRQPLAARISRVPVRLKLAGRVKYRN